MKRLLLALALISGVSFAQATRLDQVAVRLDGKAGGSGGTPTGTANRFALFGPAGTLTTDAGLTYSGTGATAQMLLGASDLGLARASAGALKITDGSTGLGFVRAAGQLLAASMSEPGSAALYKWANGYYGADTRMTSGWTLGWTSSATDSSATQDLGLARASAGVLKVTDGSTGAGKILVADGTAAAPSIAFASNTNAGMFYDSVYGLYFSQGGGPQVRLNSNGMYLDRSGFISFGNGVGFGTGQAIVSSPAAATLQLGKAPNAAPVANTLIIGESGSGTNIAGGNGTISSGIGTGSGAASKIIFQTPTAHGSDAVAQAPTTRMEIDSDYGIRYLSYPFPYSSDLIDIGYSTYQWRTLNLSRATLGSKSKAITDNGATAFATFTIADGATYTGEVIYKVKSVKGTALQALAGRARFAATREGTTYTVAVSEVGTQTLAAAAGTLTGAISIAGTAGVVTLTATFDTSQSSPDSMTIDYRFDSCDAGLAITPL